MTSRPSIDSNAGDSAKLPAEDTHEEPKPVISSSDPKPLQAPPVEAVSDGWSDDDWNVPPPPPVVKKESVEAIAPISVKPEPKTKRARRKLKQSEELPVKKEEIADSDEDAFDWDDDSIWKKESPVDKEKAPKKAPLLPSVPKPKLELSDDDWEDVPPKPAQVKNRKPVIDDWEDVPQEPRTRRPTRQSKNETPLPPKQQRNSPNTKDNLLSDLFDGYDFSKMNMEPTKPLSIEELLSMGKTDKSRSADKEDTERRKRIEECLNGLPKLEYLGLSVRVSFLLSPVGHSVLVFLMCILFLLSYTHNGRGSEQPRLQP